MVHKSLENFIRTGVIYKDASNHFGVRCPIIVSQLSKMEPKQENEPTTSRGNKDSIRPHMPVKGKKRAPSDSSLEEDNEEKATKRFRGRKVTIENRKGRNIELPRVRKHRISSITSSASPKRPPRKRLTNNMPQKIDLSKVAEHRKTQKGLNFDDCSTGPFTNFQPGADDRDSGDEFCVHSSPSLGTTDERGQLPDASDNPTENVDQCNFKPKIIRRRKKKVDEDVGSKLNFVMFD
ncbi:unnamed protein product [Hermetia illucens]|uniref:Uncharacterized protein n=2 Tax=Hermetia illucens TaxID=343691 RepID=A0A7R8UXR8_HERIL|nr:unnamed protein product [Hermetia illucens]